MTIAGDGGGRLGEYALRVAKVRNSSAVVRVSGVCASACTLFLSLPTHKICVTRGAVFKFHAPRHPNKRAAAQAKAYLLNKYPGWVRSFIAANGGLTNRLVIMPNSYARQHMRAC